MKVVLLGTQPPVWRRMQVPANASLDWLHAVLQVAIGWTNSHLHAFQVGGARYSDTRHHFAEFEGDPEILEERKFTHVGKTNLWLRKLKWPRVTEAQLRKILLGRDDYHE